MKFSKIALFFDIIVIGALASFAGEKPVKDADKHPTVYVTFWFDTEDYILPESDGAAMRLAEIFSARGVRATFKIVGEKARVLRERGREDVILALSRHDIAYHSTYHSVHPTPSEYSRDLDWQEGVQEFIRREGLGLQWLNETFGVSPSCYGQPGSSWTPESYAALRQWNIPLYLDETSHVNLNDRPFRYGGVLNILELGDCVVRTRDWTDESLQDACRRFDKARQELIGEGGGIISIYYHPCEWVHEQFWDGVNFAKGANPPREEWKLPPKKSPEATEQAFRIFEQYLDHVIQQDSVQLVTAREIASLYADEAYNQPLDKNDLQKIAASFSERISFVPLDARRIVSAAEGLYALADILDRATQLKDEEDLLQTSYPSASHLKFAYGPASAPDRFAEEAKASWNAMKQTARDIVETIDRTEQLPSVVWTDGQPWRLEDFAATLAVLLTDEWKSPGQISSISLRKGNFEARKYVADDGPNLWGWVIFPNGFNAPKMMEIAKLQAWTLKPAVLRK
ncbi:MAG: hypothetical protein AB1656_26510 [Candidatus Omnitrophota bacterium]